MENKIKVLEEYFKNINKSSKDLAVVTMFTYPSIDESAINLIKLFISSHLKFNFNSTIYLFTNFDELLSQFEGERVRVIHFPLIDNFIMTNRVIFNYWAVKYFFHYKQLFLLDTDVIALKNYSNIFTITFDVGVTIANQWQVRNRFPVNAGFLFINNLDQHKIDNFRRDYLKSYNNALSLEKKILDKKILNHDPRPFEKWWGDQYLYFLFFEYKFPQNISNYYDLSQSCLNFRFFNEDKYNLQSAKLKFADENFNLENFLASLKNVFFLHLTGNRKRHVNKIYKNLIN